MKIAFYIGTSFDLEDFKIKILNSMGKGFDAILVKRFDKHYDLVDAKQEWMHADPVFSRRPGEAEMAMAEQELGIPFKLLLRFWYNWDEKFEDDDKRMRDHYAAITQYMNYWKAFFARNKTQVFVTTYESTFPEIVSVEVAIKMGITVIFISGARMSNSFILCDHNSSVIQWRKMTEKEKNDMYAKLRADYNAAHAANNPQISKEVAMFLDFSPSNVLYKMERLRSYILNYYSMLEVDKMRTISPAKLVRKYIIGTGRQYYSGLTYEKVDFKNMDYFFFPLQYLDEVVASYPEVFVDQFELIKQTAKALPMGYKLIVKPHPHWKNRDVPVSKMRELMKARGVVVVPPNVSPYELIRHSKGVFVISSTPGLEALVLGKPVVTFGHDTLFADNDACTTIRDMAKLPAVMLGLASGKLGFNEKAARDVVTSYYKHLIFIDGKIGMNNVSLTDDDGKRIAGAITEYLEKCPPRRA